MHLRDHGKQVDVSKGNAKLTLLAGTDKQVVELKPAGTKVVAVVALAGKSSTARFVLK